MAKQLRMPGDRGSNKPKQEVYPWQEAFTIANEIRSKLERHCFPERIMVVGSLRRQCKTVHDIDIVLCPDPNDPFSPDWQRLGGGSKIVHGRHAGIPVDLYLATPDTWWTLVVIRTGSKEHNIKLCRQAKRLGMKLHADGTGLDLDDPREYHLYQPTSEEGLFAKLQLPYVEPKDRR